MVTTPGFLIRRRSVHLMVLLAYVAGGTACGSASMTQLGPSVVKCAATPSAPSGLSASGGVVTLQVTAAPECPWTATASAPWISGLSPASGQGSGSIQISLAPNPTASVRQGEVRLNDIAIRLEQPGQPCTFGVTPVLLDAAAAGGSVQVVVSTAATCTWTVDTSEGWIHLRDQPSRTGPGTVQLDVDANGGVERSATLTVAGTPVTLRQRAAVIGGPPPVPPTPPPPPPTSCAYVVTPLTASVPVDGGLGPGITVTTDPGCGWTASSSAAWLSITGGQSGSGSGSIRFMADANPGNGRTGTLLVAGREVTVSQSGLCAISVAPATAIVGNAGGAGPTLTVSTTASCSWTATASASWISFTGPSSGTGSAQLAISTMANTGAARSATIQVGEAVVIVEQASGCTTTVGAVPASFGPDGGTSEPISITAGTGCAWQASSGAPWLRITSGTSGSGSGSVAFAVDVNTSVARSTALTIAGQVFTVSQASGCTIAATPTSFARDNSAVDGLSVAVATAPACEWTASTTDDWIVITDGASGTGPGTVTFSLTRNKGNKTRTGTLLVGGVPVTVVQE